MDEFHREQATELAIIELQRHFTGYQDEDGNIDSNGLAAEIAEQMGFYEGVATDELIELVAGVAQDFMEGLDPGGDY